MAEKSRTSETGGSNTKEWTTQIWQRMEIAPKPPAGKAPIPTASEEEELKELPFLGGVPGFIVIPSDYLHAEDYSTTSS